MFCESNLKSLILCILSYFLFSECHSTTLFLSTLPDNDKWYSNQGVKSVDLGNQFDNALQLAISISSKKYKTAIMNAIFIKVECDWGMWCSNRKYWCNCLLSWKWWCKDDIMTQQNGFVIKSPTKVWCSTTIFNLLYLSHMMEVNHTPTTCDWWHFYLNLYIFAMFAMQSITKISFFSFP